MSKLRSLLQKKTWLGLFFVFLVSLAVNALCSLLLVKGVLPESSAGGCVYAAWGAGGVIGTCIAAKGQDGTLLRGCFLAIVSFGLAWLLGFLIFGSSNFGGFGWGVAAALGIGCVLGSFLGGGKKSKRHKTTGKRKAAKRR